MLKPLFPARQIAFLAEFEGKPAKVLMKDDRFRALVDKVVPTCMYHYGRNMTLYYTLGLVLNGSTTPVEVLGGRMGCALSGS